ncbi:hypothetical protein J19TS1_45940 [Heyndrickxia oleronia]|nr:hypothetical protein J19TS1_45930 [Heyndrickxia oleronia]GIN41645.1 hypothetical protein J19TS1_45940 [Heyndrickxia oleronia]
MKKKEKPNKKEEEPDKKVLKLNNPNRTSQKKRETNEKEG